MNLASSLLLDQKKSTFNSIVLTEKSILHIYDVFGYDTLTKIFDEQGKPAVLVSDHILDMDVEQKFQVKFIGLPLYIKKTADQWHKTDFPTSQSIQTDFCFNFSINKKQTNRYLLMKFVEIFGLDGFDYTWSGAGKNFDCSHVIHELDSLVSNSLLTETQRAQLLAPVQLQPKFLTVKGADKLSDDIDAVGHVSRYSTGSAPFKTLWDSGMNDLYSKSGISLIAESVNLQKGCVFTEKTLYTVFGLNFPIWIGGMGQAAMWKQIGFDIFDDIIDHSYQWHDTLIERCFYAFKRNLKILSDKDAVIKLRNHHRQRLLDNRRLVFDGIFSQFTKDIVARQHPDIGLALEPLLAYFKI